jgi:hypothetical protein
MPDTAGVQHLVDEGIDTMGPTMRLMLPASLAVLAVVAAFVLWWLATSLPVRTATSPQKLRRLADVPPEAWTRLNSKTIFFGHQSVGRNILGGLQDLQANSKSLHLSIVETKDANKIEGPVLAHAAVGRNRDPESKIAEFKELMEGGLGNKVDIAFLKLCYVDVTRDSNPDEILAAYSKAIGALKSRFPRVVFVHVTVPLCAPEKGLKERIKRLLGRSPVLDDNQVRVRYNSLLCQRYSGKEPLFDLALYETLTPEGLRHYGLRNGQEVPVLTPSYTDDGGHLNPRGRQHVAEQLLIQLLDLAGSPQ